MTSGEGSRLRARFARRGVTGDALALAVRRGLGAIITLTLRVDRRDGLAVGVYAYCDSLEARDFVGVSIVRGRGSVLVRTTSWARLSLNVEVAEVEVWVEL